MTAPLPKQWRVVWANAASYPDAGVIFVAARTREAAVAKAIGQLGFRPARVEATPDRSLTDEELAEVTALVAEIER